MAWEVVNFYQEIKKADADGLNCIRWMIALAVLAAVLSFFEASSWAFAITGVAFGVFFTYNLMVTVKRYIWEAAWALAQHAKELEELRRIDEFRAKNRD